MNHLAGSRPAPNKPSRDQQEHGGDVPDQVVREDLYNAFAYRVQSQELVVHNAVVQLEATYPKQRPGTERCAMSYIGDEAPLQPQPERSPYQHGRSEDVKDPIRDDAPVPRRVDVEIVPLKQLVKGDLVERAYHTNAEDNPGAHYYGTRLPLIGVLRFGSHGLFAS